MNTVTIHESSAPVGEAEVSALEQQLGASLPADYRAFLLAHNSGYPEPNAFPISGDYADDHGILDWFLGIRPGQSRDLGDYAQRFRTRLPPSVLPIGYDPGGNLICLIVGGPETGKVYFWDHEREADTGETPSYANMYLIAPSFQALLDSLTELPE